MVMRKQMLGLPVEVSEDGTIKLPKDMLEFAGIHKNVEVYADKYGVHLRTADIWCDFCGNNGNNTELIGDKHICDGCLEAMNEKLKNRSL
jgi:hypothetical protein